MCSVSRVPSVPSVKCDSAIPVLDPLHNAMLSTLLCIREGGGGYTKQGGGPLFVSTLLFSYFLLHSTVSDCF